MSELRNDGVEVVNKNRPGAFTTAGGKKAWGKEYRKNKQPKFKCDCCNKDFSKYRLKRHQNTAKYNKQMMSREDK